MPFSLILVLTITFYYRVIRKVMTNLDSIFKSRNTTLPTKVRLVKAMIFPVVMYGCESWTVKKAEPWDVFGRNDAKAETPVLWLPHVKS